MPKSYPEFRYSDWEWIVVHFPPAEREDMARTAWLIAQCSADEIAKHKQLDPRIVIPLCAIEFQDEINWEKLEDLKAEIQHINSQTFYLNNTEDDPIVTFTMDNLYRHEQLENLLNRNVSTQSFNNISYCEHWKNLFYCLEVNLKIKLIYSLSNSYRRPVRNDWRYLFQDLKYEFKISWHYRLAIIFILIFSVFAIIAASEVIDKQQNFWMNALTGLALYILIVFLRVPKQDPKWFIRFGLLGLLTFQRGLNQLLSSNLVKSNIDIIDIFGAKKTRNEAGWIVVLAGSVVMARAVPLAVPVSVAISVAVSLAEAETRNAWAKDWAIYWGMAVILGMAWVVSLSGPWGGTVFIAILGFWAIAETGDGSGTIFVAVCVVVAGVLAVTDAGVVVGVLTGGLLSIGRSIWYRQKDNQNHFGFLAIFTFPLFCWFPILVIFATIFILRFFSWQYTLLIWLISFSTCTALWLYGQDKERKARNPLKGILETYN